MKSSFTDVILNNLVFVDSIAKIHSVMKEYKNKKWSVSYSGGADSDTVMWLFRLCGYEPNAVMFDTGLEYDATWKHIDYMKSKGFNINIIKAKRPIPTSQRKYGHPFISKQVSGMLERLQKHNFDFQNDGSKNFDDLLELYPRCKSALRWWTNNHNGLRNSISWNSYLKEFLIENGLPFSVSGKCCDGAKKLPVKQYSKENDIDLMILGIRKSEGGSRSSAYTNCFISKKTYIYDMFFPIFWWKKEDKELFDLEMEIPHSDCYVEYGLDRTGCAGCPFGRYFEFELDVLNKYEPKLHKGIVSIFEDSYDWTRKYKEYQKFRKENK